MASGHVNRTNRPNTWLLENWLNPFKAAAASFGIQGTAALVHDVLVAGFGCRPGAQEETSRAWIGLVPKQHSSGGKDKLGGISKQGDLIGTPSDQQRWRPEPWPAPDRRPDLIEPLARLVDRCQALIMRSNSKICALSIRSWAPSAARQARAISGNRLSLASATTPSSSSTPLRPTGATIPNSARWARIALITAVCWRTNRWRVRWSIRQLCCSALGLHKPHVCPGDCFANGLGVERHHSSGA